MKFLFMRTTVLHLKAISRSGEGYHRRLCHCVSAWNTCRAMKGQHKITRVAKHTWKGIMPCNWKFWSCAPPFSCWAVWTTAEKTSELNCIWCFWCKREARKLVVWHNHLASAKQSARSISHAAWASDLCIVRLLSEKLQLCIAVVTAVRQSKNTTQIRILELHTCVHCSDEILQISTQKFDVIFIYLSLISERLRRLPPAVRGEEGWRKHDVTQG